MTERERMNEGLEKTDWRCSEWRRRGEATAGVLPWLLRIVVLDVYGKLFKC